MACGTFDARVLYGRTALPPMSGLMRGLLLAAIAVLSLPATAEAARPHVLKFACHLGDGRTHLLKRGLEAGSDDALYCWVQLGGVDERRSPRLTAELWATGVGRERPLASRGFEPRSDRYRQASVELVVAHDEWFPTVDWSPGRRPRLHLLVQVYDTGASAQRPHRERVLVARADLGHHRVHAGTPSFKDSYPPPSPSARRWSGYAKPTGATPPSSPYDDNP